MAIVKADIVLKMYEDHIANFLNKCDRSCTGQHSDSSDFETPTKIPVVNTKRGVHKIFRTIKSKSKKDKFSNSINVLDCENSSLTNKKRKADTNIGENILNAEMAQTFVYDQNITSPNGDMDYSQHFEKDNLNVYVPVKMTNKEKGVSHSKRDRRKAESETGKKVQKYKERLIFCRYRHRGIKNMKRGDESFTLRPIYLVERNDAADNRHLCGSKCENPRNCAACERSISFLDSEREIRQNNDNRKISPVGSTPMENQNKTYSVECQSAGTIDKFLQFPSDSQLGCPCFNQEISRKSQCCSTDSKETNKLNSSSSLFWKFLANKVSKKCPRNNCFCDLNNTCNPDTCNTFEENAEPSNFSNKSPPSLKKPSPPSLQESSPPSPEKLCSHCFETPYQNFKKSCTKFMKPSNLKKHFLPKKSVNELCNCRPEPSKESTMSGPCPETHSEIAKAVAAKYNGEILCIHNPPCILINGCLNLPSNEGAVQPNLWPVTKTTQKRSFAQLCKMKKGSKYKSCVGSSQYHPPYSSVQECLPEFKFEKDIQSLCNHIPRCPIVHSCFRSNARTKLQNSCVQVEVSENIFKLTEEESLNYHTCTEQPLGSKKSLMNIAEHASKAKPEAKIKSKCSTRCPHKPPCLSIPHCTANLISGNHIRLCAVPDCDHHPCCDTIPACCCSFDKDVVTSMLQCSNETCRIA